MSSCIGFKLNEVEAGILINMATGSNSNRMECVDFCNLIYKDDFFMDIINNGFGKKENSKEDLVRILEISKKKLKEIELMNLIKEEIPLSGPLYNETISLDNFMKKIMKPKYLNDLEFQKVVEEFIIRNNDGHEGVKLREVNDHHNIIAVDPMIEQNIQRTIKESKENLQRLLNKNKRELPINQFEQNFKKLTKAK